MLETVEEVDAEADQDLMSKFYNLLMFVVVENLDLLPPLKEEVGHLKVLQEEMKELVREADLTPTRKY